MRGSRGRNAVLVAAAVSAVAAFLPGCGAEAGENRLEASLARALHGGGRVNVECDRLDAPDRWSCAIEDDPGSGWSRSLLVRVGRDDCWSASPSTRRYEIKRCF